MGQRFLIDTSVIIKYLDELLPHDAILFMDTLVDTDSKVSFVTKIELLAWNPPVEKDIEIRRAFLAGSEVHYINDDVIQNAIHIRKTTNIKLPDAVIAATAIHNDYTLLSTNKNDFTKVMPLGLKFKNPETDNLSYTYS